jgi:MFS family permease
VFHGWWIVAAGGILNALAGGTYWHGFSVYFLPVTRDFGVSRAAASLAYGLGRLEGAFEGPVAGYLVDRLGPRTMIAIGGVLAGAGFILLSLTRSFPMFLLVYVGVLALGINTGFNHGVFAAVNQWFIRRKGLAMSLTSLGNSVGGFVIVPAVAAIVLNLGWRAGAAISGLVIIAVAVPLSLVMRCSPESMGLLPDGDRAPVIASRGRAGTASAELEHQGPATNFRAMEAMKTRAYWLLALAMGLRSAAIIGVIVHLVPLMVWKGQTEASGAFVVAFYAFATMPLRLLLGWVGDKWAKRRVIGISMLSGAASLVFLLLCGGEMWQLLIFAVLLASAEASNGLGWSLVGDFFGRSSFGVLRGWIAMLQSFLSMGTPVFVGWVYDSTGSYYGSLIPVAGVYLASTLVFWTLPRPRRPSRVATLTTEYASTSR